MPTTQRAYAPMQEKTSLTEGAVADAGEASPTAEKSESISRTTVGGGNRRQNHRRSNSFIMVKHVRETPDEVVDQAVAPNVNAEWVNMKGTCKHKLVLVQDDNVGLC